ncbi:Exopolysaccharide glucosyl ketal-pyruvate-transferase [Paracoccus haematequi]|uniref:Exopolysaccharide glucosyl ketal-pyruvate-transferase n=1 Tax=Paracoccus haematequi TaxID=2491866 RepID=A0A447ITE0_9RHOB|nr:polysaccharide pyruvyl transferase family protein [Paracoccus haematequi]VDS10750.1 Exopolysaccharide glucosyl ketal-pyruvate-transferase [Paracoccus haematequi]
MRLYYSVSSSGNFGDDMNEWFWDGLLTGWRDAEPDVTLFGIGTILGQKILADHGRVLVCGSGAGYGGINGIDRSRVDVSWVRGPRTAAMIGLDRALAITDPACMVTTMPRFSGLPQGSGGAIFIPHRSTARLDLDWGRIGRHAGLRVVLPSGQAQEVISEIAAADLVVTESMHGAILADAFRVPWVPVRISNEFNDFKWHDWAESVEVRMQVQDALRLPRHVWLLLKGAKDRMRALRKGQIFLPKDAAVSPGPAQAAATDLGEQGRRRVKSLARTFAPAIEVALGRDLKRVARTAPHLSRDGVVADRIDRIQDRLALVQRRIDRDLGRA